MYPLKNPFLYKQEEAVYESLIDPTLLIYQEST